jgi:uncharacterized protein YbjQ (UPF0145 family)
LGEPSRRDGFAPPRLAGRRRRSYVTETLEEGAMLLSTTEELQGFTITDYLGLVHGEVVSGANILRDVMATVTDFVGGRSAAYEEELVHSREAVLQELSDRAQRLGADAVVGLEVDFEVIGSRGAMIMVTAVGTAVRLKKD